jgi:predicted lipid-binding transport protein (Tim44 family)
MRYSSILAALALVLCLAAHDADAARRFGGGGNLGKQRPAPTATKDSTAATPAPTQAAPAASPTAAAPTTPPAKPGFMSRWGGLLAGLGIGALLASLFGAQMGPIVGLILAGLLVAFIVFALLRFFAARREPVAETQPRIEPQMEPRTSGFQGIGSAIPQAASAPLPASNDVPRRAPIGIPGFEVAPFVRVAKTSFIRLQAANDAGDLEDIRDYTTPEMYAEISMQVKERGTEPQRTEVVSLDADVVEAVVEGDYEMASVRFWGLIRENDAANPEPFDEIWHVRKKAGDGKAPWLIAGIQQAA